MTSFPQRITIVVSILILGSACKVKNPDHCEGLPYGNCKFEAGVPVPCDPACSGDKPACDMVRGECVQCTQDERAACKDNMPVCRDNTCHGCTPLQGECGPLACRQDGSCGNCTMHGECDSLACLPNGSCADPRQVAYVQAGSTGLPPCAKEAPCGTLQQGITAVNVNRPYIKISGLVDNAATTIDGKAVTILADPGTKLRRTSTGPILVVQSNNANVAIYDLEITGQQGNMDAAIRLEPNGGSPTLLLVRVKVTGSQGRGIQAMGGKIIITQSTISANMRGGISISSAEFDLTNNFIVLNGLSGMGIGGVRLDQTDTGVRRFEFNTVANNGGPSGATGISCTSVGRPVTLSSNIIYGNLGIQVGDTGTNCSWTYSDIGPDTVNGNGNISIIPLFKDVPSDFHLESASMVKDAADPSASLAVDIDGDPRPQGAADMGADEIR